MNFSTQPFPAGSPLFPSRDVVTEYLHQYAASLKHLIHYNTQVKNLTKINLDGNECWELETQNLKTHETSISIYDAVVVANGHYSDIFIPDIKGIKEFHEQYPGVISHSKYYGEPEDFKDKVSLMHVCIAHLRLPSANYAVESYCGWIFSIRARRQRPNSSTMPTSSPRIRKAAISA